MPNPWLVLNWKLLIVSGRQIKLQMSHTVWLVEISLWLQVCKILLCHPRMICFPLLKMNSQIKKSKTFIAYLLLSISKKVNSLCCWPHQLHIPTPILSTFYSRKASVLVQNKYLLSRYLVCQYQSLLLEQALRLL